MRPAASKGRRIGREEGMAARSLRRRGKSSRVAQQRGNQHVNYHKQRKRSRGALRCNSGAWRSSAAHRSVAGVAACGSGNGCGIWRYRQMDGAHESSGAWRAAHGALLSAAASKARMTNIAYGSASAKTRSICWQS